MRAIILTCAMLVGLCSVNAYALAEDPVQAAIARDFPGYKVAPTETKEINGVKVTWFNVANGSSTAVAAVTENGDFLVAGEPHDPDRLPAPVEAMYTRLFGEKPTNAERYVVTAYLITIEAHGKRDGLTFDPVGRLKDIHPETEETSAPGAAAEDVVNKDPGVTHRMEALAARLYGEGSKVEHIYPDTETENFFRVVLTGKNGEQVSMVTDGEDIYSRREKMDQHKMPQAVRTAVGTLFSASKLIDAFRRTYVYYQFDVKAPGDEIITLRIGTNGDVLEVSNEKAEEEVRNVHEAVHNPK